VLSREVDGGIGGRRFGYLREIILSRLRTGSNDPAESLSALIGASAFASGTKRATSSRGSSDHNCIFLLNAGHETTTNLISSAVDLLIRHP
jgi:cytochrome P450